ncbi:MAG TPA: cyclic nucleotide-binding domain-containing protein, partial [Spirochaetales bacterium]|nr:cyclic nucleotide-binding domain-containing protein [Spirochaetales bacterium]
MSPSDVEGVFQTHAHDDHFAGLPTLARSDHRIKYYSSALVRASVTKKACALMAIPESRFAGYFDAVDLSPGRWNDLDGLEVMPLQSPHSVETCAYCFRVFGQEGYKSYAHLADIISSETLLNLTSANRDTLDQHLVSKTMRSYLEPADIKKVDVGGGSIHGSWKDFLGDRSGVIYLSHLSNPPPSESAQVGSVAEFGQQNVLIPARQDYYLSAAAAYIRACFPEARDADRAALLNCSTVTVQPGQILQNPAERMDHVLLLVSGVVELFDTERGLSNMLPAGTFMGEHSALSGTPSAPGYRAVSVATCLSIPASVYLRFIDRKDVRKMDPFIQYAVAAADLAATDAGFGAGALEGDRTGVIVGSGIGGISSIEETHKTLLERGPD